jgi:site-specific recombinase XerC
MANPTKKMKAPKLSKLILPTLNREQVLLLIEKAETTRDKAIISLLTESGMRLSELANVKVEDINWQEHTIRVIGKGRKERDTAFTGFSEKYLRQMLSESQIS